MTQLDTFGANKDFIGSFYQRIGLACGLAAEAANSLWLSRTRTCFLSHRLFPVFKSNVIFLPLISKEPA
jgi:hypothetical protein